MLPDFVDEIIVVDNNSTDGTASVRRRWALKSSGKHGRDTVPHTNPVWLRQAATSSSLWMGTPPIRLTRSAIFSIPF